MATSYTALADELEAEMRAAGTPERAMGEKAYLKSDLEFLGVSFWEVGRRIRELVKAEPMGREDAIGLAEALWRPPIFERRAAAEEVLARNSKLLVPEDLAFIERLIRDAGTWALVDGLAGDVASSIVANHPSETTPVLDRWAADGDFWVRRSSLLAELKPLKAGFPLDRFLRHADAMLDEKEFFIRKAIGWVLREAGKKRPALVAEWLAPRTARASGITLREAVKYLPKPDAGRLMEAYREARSGNVSATG